MLYAEVLLMFLASSFASLAGGVGIQILEPLLMLPISIASIASNTAENVSALFGKVKPMLFSGKLSPQVAQVDTNVPETSFASSCPNNRKAPLATIV